MSEHVAPVGNVEEGNPDPKAPSTVVVGIAGILITVLIFIGLEVIYYKTARAEFDRKEVNTISPELVANEAEQAQRLTGYRWVDQQAGTVAIPIDRAIELVVKEYGEK